MHNGSERYTVRNERFSIFRVTWSAWLIVAGLFVAAASSGLASEIPFSDTFSYADTNALVNGSNEWGVAGSGTAIVTNGVAELVNVVLTNAFTDGENAVWTDLNIQLIPGDDTTTNPPAGSTYAFYVNTSSNVVVYDGTNSLTLTDTSVSATGTTRFTIRSDYSTDTWDLYVDEALATNDLGFYDTNANVCTEFGVYSGAGTGADTTSVDSVALDTEGPSFLTPDASFATLDTAFSESAGTVSVTVTLSQVYLYGTVLINYEKTGGTATDGEDYENYSDGQLTFTAGDQSESFTFDIINDTSNEPNETIEFTLTGSSNAGLVAPTNVTLTINDDNTDWNLPFTENFNGLALGNLAGTNGWQGEDAVVQNDVTYDSSLKAGGITSTTGRAFHQFSGTESNVWTDLYIQPVFGDDTTTNPPAGSTFAFFVNTASNVVVYDGTSMVTTTATVVEHAWTRFTVNSDYASETWDLYLNGSQISTNRDFYHTTVSAYSEFGILTGGGDSNAPVDDIYIATGTPTFLPPPVSFSPTSDSFAEDSGTVTGTVVLGWSYDEACAVDVVLAGGTASNIYDYTYTTQTLDFAIGVTTQTFTFAISNDIVAEPEETIIFGLGNFSDCTEGSNNSFTATIQVDPSEVPDAYFAATSDSVAESAGAITIDVSLSAPYPAGPLTVDYALTGGSADVADYTSYSNGQLTFIANDTSESITLTIVNDTDGEDAETLEFTLTGSTADLVSPTNFTLTIQNDPNDWSLPFTENFNGLNTTNLAGQHGWQGDDAVVQTDVTRGGSAKAGGVTSSTGRAYHTFNDDQTNVWTDLYIQPVFGDDSTTNPPSDATFAFFVNTASNVVVYNGAAMETTSVSVVKDAWTRFTVNSDYANTNWDLYVDGVLAAEDRAFYSTTHTDYNEFGVITGGGSSNAPLDDIYIATGEPTFLPPRASFAPTSASYAEDSGTVTGSVVLSWEYESACAVDVVLAGGTASNIYDYTYSTQTLNFASGITTQNFTFAISNDIVAEPEETIIFGLGNFSDCSAGADSNFTATIEVDPSEAVDASFAAISDSVAESAGAITIEVQLSAPYPVSSLTVDYALTGGSAESADYTAYSDGQLTFAANDTSENITLTIVNDTDGEDPETLEFTLTGSTANLVSPTNFTLTIQDDPNDWTLPFSETFESLALTDLNGQNGWRGTDSVVQNLLTYGGSTKAGAVTSSTGRAYHQFGGNETEVWTDFYLQPEFGSEVPTNIPSDATFVFYVNASSNVVAYNGTNATELTSVTVTNDAWTRFTVHSKYDTKQWRLYVGGGSPVTTWYEFYNTNATRYSEFGLIRGGTNDMAEVDDVDIVLSMPSGVWIPGTLFKFR